MPNFPPTSELSNHSRNKVFLMVMLKSSTFLLLLLKELVHKVTKECLTPSSESLTILKKTSKPPLLSKELLMSKDKPLMTNLKVESTEKLTP